jgi:ATP-dependent exoDNAse (exonuclease V) beta subunit
MIDLSVFDNIQFDGIRHRYFCNGGLELKSVTRRLSALKPRFDADFWANRKARERGVEPSVILAEWEQKRRDGLERGSRVHEAIQAVLDPESGAVNRAADLPEFRAFQKFWLDAGQILLGPLGVEQIVGSVGWRIAGTVDLVYTDGQNLGLIDWKSGLKFRTENDYGRLLPPFDDLDNSELANYSLQINLYRLLIERATGRDVDEAYLVHLKRDGDYELYEALDLADRLHAWITEEPEEIPF